jgi:hypothetical protein
VKPRPGNPHPSPEVHWSAVAVRLKPELAGVVDLEIRPLPSTSSRASQVLVTGTSRHPHVAILQAVVAVSPSNSGRSLRFLRRSAALLDPLNLLFPFYVLTLAIYVAQKEEAAT